MARRSRPEQRSRRPSRTSTNRTRSRVVSLAPVPPKRLWIVFLILCTGLAGLVGRMAWLQLVQAPVLEEQARQLQTQRTRPLGQRRPIVDRTGRLVAIDEKRFRLWAHPRYFNLPGDPPNLVRPPSDVVELLAPHLAIPASELLIALRTRSSGIKLGEELDPETAKRIQALGISGLDLEAYPQRIYPQASLFANVVGFLNAERVPQAGLEQSRDSDLVRHEQTRSLRRGADGTPLPDNLAPGVFYGDDLRLQLTLDSRLQELAVKALAAQVAQWKAKKGAAIVMDVTNGELLVLASTPTYNPNQYWSFPTGLFREWSVQDLYEPGSTFKPINLALALQEKAIQPDDRVHDIGQLMVGGWPINNHDKKANGLIDFAKVLQVSSNVGMVQAMRQLDDQLYWTWMHRLGIDRRPDTDLPGAVAGQLKTKEQFMTQPIEPATTAFGQGFSLTPLKLVQLHGMLANDGRLVSPHITRGFRSGAALAPAAPPSGQQLLRPEVTRTVLQWMESVVDQGSGKGVQTPGYRIGGKTGTAQKALNGIYLPGAKICSFVATLPIEDPRYVVFVAVDEPQGAHAYGSTVAVPVAKQIIDALLVVERIAPSKPVDLNKPTKS
ncbi:Peptidoglycan glycosyltransferase [Synechococcus sp. CC9902]|uniref:peptidoglycan D,D-transpeptidase FtsI family protein n=1 Tax=Synechococcus sp. (strain CC9902) TaxID=316279 RepID=UPI00005D42F7|nr:penicillin-binding protein 2 [Synechococcus sp. CC9902]ABB26612.1 Peptidoglycan glycosyltransferase [Synechococcus sp. CC9902]